MEAVSPMPPAIPNLRWTVTYHSPIKVSRKEVFFYVVFILLVGCLNEPQTSLGPLCLKNLNGGPTQQSFLNSLAPTCALPLEPPLILTAHKWKLCLTEVYFTENKRGMVEHSNLFYFYPDSWPCGKTYSCLSRHLLSCFAYELGD